MDNSPHLLPHFVDIDSLSRHTSHLDALVAMLHNYFDSAAAGGDTLSDELMSSYLWQMQHTIFELKGSIALASENKIPRTQLQAMSDNAPMHSASTQ